MTPCIFLCWDGSWVYRYSWVDIAQKEALDAVLWVHWCSNSRIVWRSIELLGHPTSLVLWIVVSVGTCQESKRTRPKTIWMWYGGVFTTFDKTPVCQCYSTYLPTYLCMISACLYISNHLTWRYFTSWEPALVLYRCGRWAQFYRLPRQLAFQAAL